MAQALPRLNHSLAGRVLVEEGALEALAVALEWHGSSSERVAAHAIAACVALARLGGAWRERVLQAVGARAMVGVIGRYGLPSRYVTRSRGHTLATCACACAREDRSVVAGSGCEDFTSGCRADATRLHDLEQRVQQGRMALVRVSGPPPAFACRHTVRASRGSILRR
jgi:hypothetical protein